MRSSSAVDPIPVAHCSEKGDGKTNRMLLGASQWAIVRASGESALSTGLDLNVAETAVRRFRSRQKAHWKQHRRSSEFPKSRAGRQTSDMTVAGEFVAA